MCAGIPGLGEEIVFGEMEYVEWLSDTRDGACRIEAVCEISLNAGEINGLSGTESRLLDENAEYVAGRMGGSSGRRSCVPI